MIAVPIPEHRPKMSKGDDPFYRTTVKSRR